MERPDDTQVREQFLKQIGERKFLFQNKREVYRVFVARFTYENQLKTNQELAKLVSKELPNFNLLLRDVYAAFSQDNGGPLGTGEAGKRRAKDLFCWLWNIQFPDWLKEQGIISPINPKLDLSPPYLLTEPKGQLTLELQVTSNSPVLIEKKVKVVLDIEQLSPQELQAILKILKQRTGDDSLILLGLEKGSLVLVLGGSQEGVEQLEYLFKSGQLTELLGIHVKDVRDATADSTAVAPMRESVNLSQWLQNNFAEAVEAGWQTLEEIFGTRTASLAVRYTTAKRAKLINLGINNPVALIVILTPESEQEINILLQVRPTDGQIYLPQGLKLTVVDDESGTTLCEGEAPEGAEFIQGQLSRHNRERFSVKVVLGDESVTEEFVIEPLV
jgi:hypothetical protein